MKGSMYVPTTSCIPSNGSVSDEEEETLARQVWPLILYHITLTRSTDVKILPDTVARNYLADGITALYQQFVCNFSKCH